MSGAVLRKENDSFAKVRPKKIPEEDVEDLRRSGQVTRIGLVVGQNAQPDTAKSYHNKIFLVPAPSRTETSVTCLCLYSHVCTVVCMLSYT